MRYKQLTHEERYHIYALRKAGKKLKNIAKEVGTNKSTISRELRRNRGKRGYRPDQAHEKATERRQKASKRIKLDQKLKNMIIEKLELDWSPEQIAGYFKKNKIANISSRSIYTWLALDRANGGNLYKFLRRSHKKRRKKYGSSDTRGQIANRISIEQRPKIVEKKSRIGDWELDTMMGKNNKGAIVTAVDRKSKLVKLRKVESKHAHEVTKAVVKMLGNAGNKVHTLTADNGKEFAYHEKIALKLKADFYFAHPYSSWERGLNENTNGLVRQYIPKKTAFVYATGDQLKLIEKRLNSRPRKSLNFRTPQEAFDASNRR